MVVGRNDEGKMTRIAMLYDLRRTEMVGAATVSTLPTAEFKD
jgi:hypothetical protein